MKSMSILMKSHTNIYVDIHIATYMNIYTMKKTIRLMCLYNRSYEEYTNYNYTNIHMNIIMNQMNICMNIYTNIIWTIS